MPSGDQPRRSVLLGLSPEGLHLFCDQQQRRRFCQGLLLLAQFLLEPFDLALVLGAELLQLPLFFQRQYRLLVGILRCLPPALHLLRVQTPLPAIGADLGGVQPSGLQHHRELVSSAPALRVLLLCRHHLSLQPPALAPSVESADVDARLLGNPRHALTSGRTHPFTDVSFDSLAVTPHWSSPQAPAWSKARATTFLTAGVVSGRSQRTTSAGAAAWPTACCGWRGGP